MKLCFGGFLAVLPSKGVSSIGTVVGMDEAAILGTAVLVRLTRVKRTEKEERI